MEQVRDRQLDNFCEAIAEHRAAKNDAIVREQSDISGALLRMQKTEKLVYKHAGVELARVPGAEKLRVRLVKGEGDADETDLETAPASEGADGGEFEEERAAALEEIGGE
jgi:hypothetical protein